MSDYQLINLVGKKVQIDRGGPESKSGVILAVGTDYIVLSTPSEGNLYYYIEHIKSITLSNTDTPHNILQEEFVADFEANNETPETMKEVFASKKFKLIQINRGGPEKIKGILTDIYDDYVGIVSQDEVILVVYSHIKSSSFPGPKNEDEGKESSTESNDSLNAKKQNKSTKNKSKK